jgi:SAM-dependent methyltransferase
MQQDASPSRVKETFDNWSLYDAVIQNNYMQHRELAIALRAIAQQLPEDLRIVDLGCGDAWLALHAFAGLSPAEYKGVDLSEAAVLRAQQHVAHWGPHASVQCGNILDFVAALPNSSVSLVLASYSLHHFGEVHKAEIVKQCFRILKPGGSFCWIDPVRNGDESRDAYVCRLTDSMQADWIGLDEVQRKRATQHVWDCDFPETASWMHDCCTAAGFQNGRTFLHTQVFGGWQFVKA